MTDTEYDQMLHLEEKENRGTLTCEEREELIALQVKWCAAKVVEIKGRL